MVSAVMAISVVVTPSAGMMGAMYTVRPALQPYAWGTRDDIPALLDIEPTESPVAEAWWGTHVDGPAMCVDRRRRRSPFPRSSRRTSERPLGPSSRRRWPTAPCRTFLKVLAVGRPIVAPGSPGRRGRRRRFRAGGGGGDSSSASPDRVYRDRSHKPELRRRRHRRWSCSRGSAPPAGFRADLAGLDHPQAVELARPARRSEDPRTAALASYLPSVPPPTRRPRGLNARARASSGSSQDANPNVHTAAAAADPLSPPTAAYSSRSP